MPERRQDPFAFEKMLDWLKPNAQLGAAGERGMQSATQVGQLLTETAQAVMKKQSEILSQSINSMAASMKELPKLRTPQDLLELQTASFRAGYEAAAKNMREIGEILQRCGTGVADLWLHSLASDGQAAPPGNAPVPIRKAAG